MHEFKYAVDIDHIEDGLEYGLEDLNDMHDRFTVSKYLLTTDYELTCSHPDFVNLVVI